MGNRGDRDIEGRGAGRWGHVRARERRDRDSQGCGAKRQAIGEGEQGDRKGGEIRIAREGLRGDSDREQNIKQATSSYRKCPYPKLGCPVGC